MNSFVASLARVAVAVAAVSLMTAGVHAQSVSEFLGGSGTTELQQTGWTTAGNWNTGTVATGTDRWAQINSSSASVLRIAYSASSIGTSGTLIIGAMSFLPTLSVAGGVTTYEVRNSSTTTRGTARFYGIDTTIDGVPRRIILDNRTSLTDVGFSQAARGQDIELHTDGVINVNDATSLTLSPTIRDGGGVPRSITKIGGGTLSFSGVSYGGSTTNSSGSSSYSGGFTLDGGIVQWANSGGSTASPFGTGTLTLRSGTLRSTSSTGRSINTDVLLDGTVTLGSTAAGFTGEIDVNSASGTRSTTILGDSVVAIAGSGTTAWAQATSGAGSLTKIGTGALRFSGVGGALAHTGSTAVQEGSLIMNANLSSASVVSVSSNATLFGTGTIAGATTILAGATFSPGATDGAAGLFTFGSGGLALGGQTLLEFSGTSRGTQFDAVDLSGPLTYGGQLELQFSGTLPLGTYSLFGGFSSQAGTFSSITLSGGYAGALTEESPGIWSGAFGDQTITFTNASGTLAFVPEPSAMLLGGIGAAAVAWRWSRRRLRRSA